MAIIEPKTKQEYEAVLKQAKGSVVVDFIQQGCGACDPKQLEGLAQSCEGKTTIMRVDCTDGWGSEVADRLGVEGTPTTLLSTGGKDFLTALTRDESSPPADLDIEEVDPTDPSTAKRIKCSR